MRKTILTVFAILAILVVSCNSTSDRVYNDKGKVVQALSSVQSYVAVIAKVLGKTSPYSKCDVRVNKSCIAYKPKIRNSSEIGTKQFFNMLADKYKNSKLDGNIMQKAPDLCICNTNACEIEQVHQGKIRNNTKAWTKQYSILSICRYKENMTISKIPVQNKESICLIQNKSTNNINHEHLCG